MVFYIDIFFFINFLFDFLIIVLSGRLGGVRFSILRITSAALLGAVLACINVLLCLPGGFLPEVIPVALMSLTAYGFGTYKSFLRQTLILFMGFFVSGGAALALCFNGFFDDYVAEVLSAVVFALLLTFFVSEKIKKGKNKIYAEVYVFINGDEYILSGIYDSGNLCTDYHSGLPVIIAEDVFRKVKMREGFFDTASGRGKMKIFLPDKVRIKYGGRIYESRDIAVGVVPVRLSLDGSFNALIGGLCFERLVEKNKNNNKKFSYGR